MFALNCVYGIRGPIPKLAELEMMCNSNMDVWMALEIAC